MPCPAGVDPQLAASANSPSKSNARARSIARRSMSVPPEPLAVPDIDYLAKDYASFRRLMLDRMAVLMPQWKERNTADLGSRAGRSAGLQRRSVELSAGRRRHRGLSAARRASAFRCGAMRA